MRLRWSRPEIDGVIKLAIDPVAYTWGEIADITGKPFQKLAQQFQQHATADEKEKRRQRCYCIFQRKATEDEKEKRRQAILAIKDGRTPNGGRRKKHNPHLIDEERPLGASLASISPSSP